MYSTQSLTPKNWSQQVYVVVAFGFAPLVQRLPSDAANLITSFARCTAATIDTLMMHVLFRLYDYSHSCARKRAACVAVVLQWLMYWYQEWPIWLGAMARLTENFAGKPLQLIRRHLSRVRPGFTDSISQVRLQLSPASSASASSSSSSSS